MKVLRLSRREKDVSSIDALLLSNHHPPLLYQHQNNSSIFLHYVFSSTYPYHVVLPIRYYLRRLLLETHVETSTPRPHPPIHHHPLNLSLFLPRIHPVKSRRSADQDGTTCLCFDETFLARSEGSGQEGEGSESKITEFDEGGGCCSEAAVRRVECEVCMQALSLGSKEPKLIKFPLSSSFRF